MGAFDRPRRMRRRGIGRRLVPCRLVPRLVPRLGRGLGQAWVTRRLQLALFLLPLLARAAARMPWRVLALVRELFWDMGESPAIEFTG